MKRFAPPSQASAQADAHDAASGITVANFFSRITVPMRMPATRLPPSLRNATVTRGVDSVATLASKPLDIVELEIPFDEDQHRSVVELLDVDVGGVGRGHREEQKDNDPDALHDGLRLPYWANANNSSLREVTADCQVSGQVYCGWR